MNVFQNCQNTSDAVPLYLPQQLYLKPIAKVNISIQLPNIRKIGKSISHWEVMDKLKALVKPDEFTILKVTKTTLEFVRFEAEVDLKSKLEKVISRLDNRMIKLKDFNEMMRVRAAEAKSDCPNRRTWDGFFDESKDMDESKPGERADTIHLANLPTKWFVPYHQSGDEDITPSETLFYRIFEKFGKIRFVDIPICDPYRNKMKDHISGLKQSSFEDKRFFEAYVQFKDYIGFAKAMDAFRDMKLLHKEEDDDAVAVKIKVDFDKSKHLSDASIRRREIVRERLVKKTREKEEKEKVELEEKNRQDDLERQKEQDLKIQKEIRRKVREEKRKLKILNKLEINGSDEINEKIAKEERKLVKVQRKLEAIRLVEELFRRVKEKNQEKDDLYDKVTLGHKELKKFKDTSELAVLTQREKLHHAIKGRVMLKTILSGTKLKNFSSSSSDTSDADETKTTSQRRPMTPPEMIPNSEPVYDPIWYGFPYQLHPAHNLYAPPMRGMFNTKHMVNLRHNPGTSRGGHPRRSRGYRGGYRGRNNRYPPELEQQYEKYFSKFLHEHDDRRRSRSHSRSRSLSHHRSTRRSSRSSRRHSYRRSSSSHRSYSRSRSRTRRSRSHSYKSRNKGRRRSYSRSPSTSRRSKRSGSRRRSRSRSKSRSPLREKSVDSSKFMTPQQLRQAKSRSKTPETK